MAINIKEKAQVIVDKYSKLLRIDLKYVMRGGTLLSLTQITSAFFGLILTFAFAHYLPKEIYGVYRYILATYALLVITSLPGLDTAVVETVAKGNHRAFFHSIKTKFVYGFIGTFLSILYGLYYLLVVHDSQLFFLFVLVGFFLPFIECFSLYTAVLNAQKRFGFWTLTEIINQIFSTISLFVTIYLTTNIFLIISAYFIPYIVVRIIATIYVLKHFIKNEQFDPGYLSYGKAMTIYQIITRGISSIDQLVLFHFMGPVQVAIFSIAYAIPSRLQSVLRITGTLAFPKYAQASVRDIMHSIRRKMLIFGIGILTMCIVYVFVAPVFFHVFFPKYNDAISYTQVLVFFTLSAVTYPFGAFLNAHKKIRENYIFALISLSVKVACIAILVPRYGVWGAVWGIVLSSWSTIFATYFFIWKLRRNEKTIDIATEA